MISKNRGVPIFMDCSETTSFTALLETGVLSLCNWIVFNESSITSLLQAVNEKELMMNWSNLSILIQEVLIVVTMNSMKMEELKNALEDIMLVIKKKFYKSTPLTVLVSLQNCGQWISSINTSISTTWMKSDNKTSDYESMDNCHF